MKAQFYNGSAGKKSRWETLNFQRLLISFHARNPINFQLLHLPEGFNYTITIFNLLIDCVLTKKKNMKPDHEKVAHAVVKISLEFEENSKTRFSPRAKQSFSLTVALYNFQKIYSTAWKIFDF